MGKKVWLLIIIFLGVVLRLVNLNQSLWLDEAAQAMMSNAPIRSIFYERQADFHPPLFYLVAHYWQLVNRSDWWLRLLPASFGVFNILAIYTLCKAFKPNSHIKIINHQIDTALVAALLLAISPFHIYYSQEYRSYSLLCLLSTLSLLPLLRVEEHHKPKDWLLLGFINGLIVYTHYSGAFVLLTQAVYISVFHIKHLRSLALSWVLTGLLFFPWIPQLISQLHAGINIEAYLPGWGKVLSLPTFSSLPLVLFKLVAGRITFEPKIIYATYVAAVVIFTLGVILISTFRKKLSVLIFTPILSMILISLVIPQTQPFRLIFLVPLLLVAIVTAAPRSPKTILSLAIYISLFGNILYFTRPRLQREQWRQVLEFTSSKYPIIVKFPGPFAPISWYEPTQKVIPALTRMPANQSDVTKQLQAASLPANIYLFQYLTGLSDPQLQVEQVLGEMGYKEIAVKDFSGVGFIYTYSLQNK